MIRDWPSSFDDYAAGAPLRYAWQAGHDRVTRSRPYLMAAWGYTVGMADRGFFRPILYGGTMLRVFSAYEDVFIALAGFDADGLDRIAARHATRLAKLWRDVERLAP